jgi:hypothetical protein|tara:strand:+ start:74 stop:247 length:174 start_codon:yes stop_codon:yes gene_type:complete
MAQIKDTFKDEQGTLHALADMLPAQPGDDDYVDVDNGQCCCGEYQCKEEYSHWSSGY